jgi:putative mRNA 3-end processing factor
VPAKSTLQQEAPVSWRDGIHLTRSSIWCDARRSREICFVSSASAMPGTRHGQLIATPKTLELMGPNAKQAASQLAVPYGQPFTLGAHRIELFNSGHGLGAASLLVDSNGQRVIYAGCINPNGSLLGGALDHRAADVLVVSGRYGQNHYAFDEATKVTADIVEHAQDIAHKGGVAVLLIASLEKAMDTAALFAPTKLNISAHRSIHGRMLNEQRAAIRRWSPGKMTKQARPTQVLLWPLAARDKLDMSTLPSASQILLLSGIACDSSQCESARANAAYAWSSQADQSGLIRYIKSCGASLVYLTHAPDQGSDLGAQLSNVTIKALGPPEQLSLF